MPRYIDIEPIIAETKSMKFHFEAISIDGIIDRLEAEPTADVVEVVHGKNITENHPADEFVCSECGFICEGYVEVIIDDHDLDRSNMECEFNFCPNCGAYMKGESTT